MSPLNRGPLLGPRIPSAGARPLPPPRFGIVPPGTPPRMLPPMNPIFGGHMAMRHRLPPPSRLPGGISRPNGMLPLFPGGPRARSMTPIVPPMVPHGSGPQRGPLVRPWLRRMPMPQIPHVPHVRRRFIAGNGNAKGKTMNNTKKVNKLEELELKKPWMTDEIRNEIQKKNRLYAKAKKHKDAVEWEEFKDLRNKVTRMIRDAKNEYFAKHPEQGGQKTDDNNDTIDSEGVQKTENSTEQSEQKEQTEETRPSSEQAHLYPDEDEEDENNICSDEDTSYREDVCNRDFPSEDTVSDYESIHTCGVDGCTYTANFLLVEKHLRVEHNKDLLLGNKNVSTSFIKWMMQRRRKFLQIRKINEAKELEKLERGEIIKQVCNVQTRKINTREKKHKFRKRRIREVGNDYVCTVDTYRGLHPFPGIGEEEEDKVCLEQEIEQADLCEKVICNISDEDDNVSEVIISESINSCLPVLVADYTDGTDDDEVPQEMPIEKVKTLDFQDDKTTKDVANGETFVQVQEKASDTLQISTNIQYTDISAKSNKKSRNAAKCRDKHKNEKKHISKEIIPNNNKKEKIFHKYRNKFLENLLSRDIQHERNLICQCMKYIIDNNFFDLNGSL